LKGAMQTVIKRTTRCTEHYCTHWLEVYRLGRVLSSTATTRVVNI